MFICSESFKCLWAIIFTLDPLCHPEGWYQNGHNWLLLPQECCTLPPGHVNFSSFGRMGLVPGLQDVLEETTEIITCSTVKLHAEVVIEHYREMKILYNYTRAIAISHF